ncbi:glutathione transferase GstA [Thorsellia kenyensis]|uniref:Glutathione transferase GstA n=1 Tax=Thorsellia kenyensis TaxID=1549888 RepID=A0ABV6C7Z8_9GAMM
MKLFYSAGSCSVSPHIALNEANLPYTMESVNLATKVMGNGENYLAINPNGQVPALMLDDGTLLTEGAAIVQFIADLASDKNLLPAVGQINRYKALSWLNYISTELHKGFSPLYNPRTPEEYKAIAIENIHKKFEYLNAHLEKNTYLLGDSYCVADGYLFTVINWTHFLKMDISKYSHLCRFMNTMMKRDAVIKTLEQEGLNLQDVW